MKRTIALILVATILFCLFLTGCQDDVVYCPECGEGTREGASFCADCGGSLGESNKSEEEIYAEITPQELLPKDDTNYSVLDKGSCNGNVYWEIRSNGVLSIYGMGTIPNYRNGNGDAPWISSAVSSEITDIVIEDGITGVGEYAFRNMYVNSISFGHDVITYMMDTGGIAEIAYIPSSMKDVYTFLNHSYTEYYGVDGGWYTVRTIYYEGTEDEWYDKCEWYLPDKEDSNGYELYCNINIK